MMALVVVLLCVVVQAFAHEPLSQELIDFVNKVQDDWQAAENERMKLVTFEQIQGMMGVLKSEEDPNFGLPVITRRVPKDIPEHFDAREKWSFCPTVHEVRDQSACGSCWAFGAASTISDRICIHSNGRLTPHISAEDMMSCCAICGEGGCKGGAPEAAFKHWVDTGLVTGSNYEDHAGCSPYLIPPCDHHKKGRHGTCGKEYTAPACKKQCQKGYGKTYEEDKYFGKRAYIIKPNDTESMQREIMTYGPVEMGFTVYADFLNYHTGVYHHTTGKFVGEHAVRVLGWGTENGVPYWLVANSWNADWGGMHGFFKVRRGVNECGFETQVVAGMARV